MIESKYQWPMIFETEDLSKSSNAMLCADALCAWGNCRAGSKPPESFGRVMAKIGAKLHIVPTPEAFMKWSENFVKE